MEHLTQWVGRQPSPGSPHPLCEGPQSSTRTYPNPVHTFCQILQALHLFSRVNNEAAPLSCLRGAAYADRRCSFGNWRSHHHNLFPAGDVHLLPLPLNTGWCCRQKPRGLKSGRRHCLCSQQCAHNSRAGRGFLWIQGMETSEAAALPLSPIKTNAQ